MAPFLLDEPTLFRRLIPLPPRQRYPWAAAPADLLAAFTVLFLAVPQGLAYATIAGLPPAVGLYAATVPTIVSSVFRSSRHVVSGPTNALSLLVGAVVARGLGADPVQIAITLALMVGVMQAAAGLLRLGAVVDFISSAVVLGYITGAGVLIGIGQLYNATGTEGERGRVWITIGGWLETLGATHSMALVVAAGTVLAVVVIRVLNRRTGKRIPSAIVAMTIALLANLLLGLEAQGLRVVSDLAEIPAGLPPLTLPDPGLAPQLVTAAVACAVLSLVESSSVARSIASRSGQKLDASVEFFGQGLSNLSAAFFGGYPVSGSLSRSALNERVGAKTRVAGIVTGVLMVAVLLALGPLLNHTPIASLAGLMFVVAYDLVDVRRIKSLVRASKADAAAFVATLVGTWTLSLDVAIYLGVGISLVLFLRRARMVRVVELVPDQDGVLQEQPLDAEAEPGTCPRIRVLHVEGPLFFGAAGELHDSLTGAVASDSVRALVIRLKRAQGLDATTTSVLVDIATRLRETGRRLILVGMTPDDMEVLERAGAIEAIGADCVFPTRSRWFSALRAAIAKAVDVCGEGCADCPLARAARLDPVRGHEGQAAVANERGRDAAG